MDNIKAKKLEQELVNTNFNEYKILSLINYGKTAAVFKVELNKYFYALKIFDNELVESFGYEIQIKRIEQEINLKNHNIDNLIKIIDGGVKNILSNNYYFIVMEYVEGKNLKQFIETETYDENFIIYTFKTLNEVTEKLLSFQTIFLLFEKLQE